jgi:hypothetical protein
MINTIWADNVWSSAIFVSGFWAARHGGIVTAVYKGKLIASGTWGITYAAE